MAIRGEIMAEWGELIDLERKTVSPRVFTDPDVYQAEQERVFGRCWLYVAHESQAPQPGDFVTNYMGEEPVIVCRDADGRVRVFINSCRHRGMRVCRTDAGNTRTFQCPYHGWTYDVQGRLVGVPQYQEAYHGELKREEWGLLEVPRVESYLGLIFASFAEEVESLEAYLGEMRSLRSASPWGDGRNPKISVGRCGFSRAVRLTTLPVKCSTLMGE